MWLTRDEDGTLTIFFSNEKPIRNDIDGMWCSDETFVEIDGDYPPFDNITWEDEPVECDIIIKKKKKRI